MLDALVRRRAAEKALFLTPTLGFLPAPSQVLRPKVDHDTTGHVPASRPVEVAAVLEGETVVAERIGPAPESNSSSHEPPFASQVAADAITARLQSILKEHEAPAPTPVAEPPQPIFEEPPLAPIAAPEPELDLPQPPEPEAWAVPPVPTPIEAEAPAQLEPIPEEPPMAWSETSIAERAEPEPRVFSPDPMTFEDFESRKVAHHDYQTYAELEAAPTEPLKGLNPITLWLSAGAFGLVVFAAGIFFGFSAKNSGPGGLIGWGLGLVGIVFVAAAVYFLLERLGGREEP